MSQPKVTWGVALRFFSRRGYEIRASGGDKIIIAPKDRDPARRRQTVRIGHHYCGHAGDELLPAHLSAIARAFGITRRDLLEER
jgi:hypothetical protein